MLNYLLILVSLILCSGCSVLDAPTPMPVAEAKVVVVTAPFHCPACERQKDLLAKMQRAGELDGVKVVLQKGGTPEYPVGKYYPTLYVCSKRGSCSFFDGYTDRHKILDALK